MVTEHAMTFEDVISTLVGWRGERVDAAIWGKDENDYCVAILSGELERVEPLVGGPRELAGVDLVTAEVFRLGATLENNLSLWPDRFVQAAPLEVGEGVEIVTMDAIIRISKRRPWVD